MDAQLIRPLLRRQLIIAAALLAVVFFAALIFHRGDMFAVAIPRARELAFGMLIGLAATLVTARGVSKSAALAATRPHLAKLPVYAAGLWKLGIMIGGAYLAFARFDLSPIFVILGYIAMQTGFIWHAFGDRKKSARKQNSGNI